MKAIVKLSHTSMGSRVLESILERAAKSLCFGVEVSSEPALCLIADEKGKHKEESCNLRTLRLSRRNTPTIVVEVPEYGIATQYNINAPDKDASHPDSYNPRKIVDIYANAVTLELVRDGFYEKRDRLRNEEILDFDWMENFRRRSRIRRRA